MNTMNEASYKKYITEYISVTGIIVNYALAISRLIPLLIADILVTVILGVYIFSLWKSKKEPAVKIVFSALSILIAAGAVYNGIYLHSSETEAIGTGRLAQTKIVSKTNSEKNGVTQSNNEINGNNNSVTVTPTTVKGQYVQVGDGNTINVKEYNSPVPRHLTKPEEKQLEDIPFNYSELSVLYPPNNNEAKHYADEIIRKLYDLGHPVVSAGTITNPLQPANKRFDIQVDEKPVRTITIIINSQL